MLMLMLMLLFPRALDLDLSALLRVPLKHILHSFF
jgi:hypothetical protein